MKKASEYRQYAADCRALAARMELGSQRDQLFRMAGAWDQLANERDAQLRPRGEEMRDGEAADAPRCFNS